MANNRILVTENDAFVRHVLAAAPALGVDEHGIWLLDLRVNGQRWYVEATQDDGVWNVLSMTARDPGA